MAALVLNSVIGTGVFLKARVMICNVGTPGAVMAVWVVAGLLSLAGTLAYAELSTLMPRSGGEYSFLGAAYGRFTAFLFGWTKTVAGPASDAAVAIVFAIFLNDLLGGRLSGLSMRLVPVLALAVSAAMNLAAVRTSGHVSTALTAMKVALVAGVGVAAFVFGDGQFEGLWARGDGGTCAGVEPGAMGGLSGFGAAMLGALWGYQGWNNLVAVGGEVADPGRTLPRALFGGMAVVMALYLLLTAAYFWVLTPVEVASVPADSSVAYEMASRFLGSHAAVIMAVGLMISSFGTLFVAQLTGARVPFALARDGLLPRSLAAVSVRRVPAVSIVFKALLGMVFAVSGSFDSLTDMYVFVLWIFYGMTGLSLFVLRRRFPDVERPCRAWGYPLVPGLFLVVTAFLLVNAFIAAPLPALSGLGLILSGIPVYRYHSRRTPPSAAAGWLGGDERVTDRDS